MEQRGYKVHELGFSRICMEAVECGNDERAQGPSSMLIRMLAKVQHTRRVQGAASQVDIKKF